MGKPRFADPAHGPIVPPDSVFDFKFPRWALPSVFDHPSQIFGMNRFQKGFDVRLLRPDSKGLVKQIFSYMPGSRTALCFKSGVRQPKHFVDVFGELAEPFFAFAQRCFG